MKIAVITTEAVHLAALPMVRQEVSEIVNQASRSRFVDVYLLNDPTAADLMRLLPDDTEMLWFPGHGSEAGIPLKDSILTAAELVMIIANKDTIRHVFINSCSSMGLAIYVLKEADVDVVVSILDDEVKDRPSYMAGALLIRQLAIGKNLFDAVEAAQPGMRGYIILRSKRSSEGHGDAAIIQNALQMFEARMRQHMEFLVDEAVRRALAASLRRRVSLWINGLIIIGAIMTFLAPESHAWITSHPGATVAIGVGLFVFMVVLGWLAKGD